MKSGLDIINNYFHGIKTAYLKQKNQTEGNDEGEMIHEKMGYLRNQTSITTTLWNNLVIAILPTNIYKIAALYLTTNGEVDVTHTEIVRVNKADLLNINANPLTKPTVSRPVYILFDTGDIGGAWQAVELHPFARYNINTQLTADLSTEESTTTIW